MNINTLIDGTSEALDEALELPAFKEAQALLKNLEAQAPESVQRLKGAVSARYWGGSQWMAEREAPVKVVGRARTFGFGDSTFTFTRLFLPNYRGLVCLLDNDTLSRRTFTLTDINQRLQGTLNTAPAQRFDNPFILAVDTQETFQALNFERARRIANGERDRGDSN